MVALHRAVALARKNPQARLLLTTFSEPLARSLSAKLVVLAPETGGIAPRITISDWHGVADELFQLIHGRRPRVVGTDMLRIMIAKAADAAGVRGFTQRFLLSEWTNVVDAWGIDGPERYAGVPRLGRRSPLGPRQRERLWSVFGPVAAALREQEIFTRCGVCREAAAYDRGEEAGQVGAYANAAKYCAAEAGFRACETAIMTHGGMGYAATSMSSAISAKSRSPHRAGQPATDPRPYRRRC